MNDFILTGIIKNELTLKTTKEGTEYCAISLEVDPRFKDKKNFPLLILSWQNIATSVCKDLHKGDYVKLEGYIKPAKTKNGDDGVSLVLFSYRLFKHNEEIQKDFVYKGENKVVDLVLSEDEIKEILASAEENSEEKQEQGDTIEEEVIKPKKKIYEEENVNPFDEDLTY